MEKVSVNANKALQDFRNYEDSQRQAIVELHYRKMREHQTVAYVRAMYAKYHSFNHAKMTIAEAFQALKGYVHSLSRTHFRSLSLSLSLSLSPIPPSLPPSQVNQSGSNSHAPSDVC